MGNQQVQDGITGEQLRLFMRSLLDDLRALEMMIEEGRIEADVRRIGAEQEMFLVGPGFRPAPLVMEMIEGLKDPHFTTELARFNLEANMEPLSFGGRCLSEMEEKLSALVGKARECAAGLDAEIALVGILPTLRKSDLGLENMAPVPRYFALNQAMNRLRGGAYEFQIKGIDELIVKHDSVMVESCNTSFQVHFQVGAKEFAKLYNIAQAVAGPVLAAATNSPLLFGRRLWRETRIALFQQAVDTRSSSHHLRERQPRVSFGRNWVRESVIELFQEDIARFKILIGGDLDEDPFAVLREGKVPQLKALRLHNGTVYRWNRPCYGITDGKPHLRIENRYIPSGPTIRDEVANGALWFGLVCALSREVEDITRHLDFEQAQSNFIVGRAQRTRVRDSCGSRGRKCRHGTSFSMSSSPSPAPDSRAAASRGEDIDLYLGVLEERVRTKQTGSQWFHLSLAGMKGKGTEAERMTRSHRVPGAPAERGESGLYVEARDARGGGWVEGSLHEGGAVHVHRSRSPFRKTSRSTSWRASWTGRRSATFPSRITSTGWWASCRIARSSIFSPKASSGSGGRRFPVSDVMKRDLITVAPETSTQEAILLMKERRIGSLPVVKDGRLIGIVTERDFMDIATELLEEKLKE